MLRQIQILKMIPREPDTVTTAGIKKKLEECGFSINIRTIQRNLVELSTKFPLIAATDEKDGISLRWSWDENAEIINIPSMDSATALSFSLVEQIVARILPRQTLNLLNPYFLLADEILQALEQSTTQTCSGKFRVISPQIPSKSPALDTSIVEALYRALLEEKQLRIRYHDTTTDKTIVQEVHPLALVFQEGQGHLIWAIQDLQETRTLSLYQIKSARLLPQPRQIPPGFHLDTYIDKGFPGSA